jgi:phage terminase large subunit-like protein
VRQPLPVDPRHARLASLLREAKRRAEVDRLGEYGPNGSFQPTPKQLDFHSVGGEPGVRHRCLAAANQSGKTTTAAYEVAMHLTGRYPAWWKGYRFTTPIKCWVSGVTAETTRDTCQALLLGEKRAWGTGTIPKDALYGDPSMARSVADAVDGFQTRHVSGGFSTCWFKSYDRGREKWQGATLHLIWYDEEPPEDIYNEGQTRLNRHRGPSMMTFTPLKGMTPVVQKFFKPDLDEPESARAERRLIQMDLYDATFYTREEMEAIEAAYPAHERRARARGLPIFGSGLIYPVARSEISCDPFPLPPHYRRIAGLDFGLAHPTAAVWLAHDPDTDTIYLYDLYKQIDHQLAVHAAALRTRGTFVPIAWPHDGLKRDPRSGIALAELYRQTGLPNMLSESARYDPDKGGSQPIFPIAQQILDRMRSGRFKVFSSLSPWFDEQSTYHIDPKTNKPVDYNDDLLTATHYAMMELRSARPLDQPFDLYPATYGGAYDPLDARI